MEKASWGRRRLLDRPQPISSDGSEGIGSEHGRLDLARG